MGLVLSKIFFEIVNVFDHAIAQVYVYHHLF